MNQFSKLVQLSCFDLIQLFDTSYMKPLLKSCFFRRMKKEAQAVRERSSSRPCPDYDEVDINVHFKGLRLSQVPADLHVHFKGAPLSNLPGLHKAGHELVIDNVPAWEECGKIIITHLVSILSLYFLREPFKNYLADFFR